MLWIWQDLSFKKQKDSRQEREGVKEREEKREGEKEERNMHGD